MEEFTVPPYLSPSSIDTFRQCPLKFKYSRIDRLYDPPTEATTLGSFVHAVLEALFALPSNERTIAAARNQMSLLWNSSWKTETEAVIGAKQEKLHAFRWNAWWCIENYFKLEAPTEIDPKGIEHELNGKIDGVSIKGYIDRWHQSDIGIVISDYKTGKTPREPYVDGKFFQLYVYAKLLEQETQIPVDKVELLYLKDGVRLNRGSDQNLASEIEAMTEVVVETSNAVTERCKKGFFEPTPNKLCDWCSYKSFCPAWKK